ncbi:MAG TPA: hypothetical protein VFH80_13250 [Solirubrobacteraceae bacterium]|nr:hypothetical protein [Solirubrobacteraceae bacterium]
MRSALRIAIVVTLLAIPAGAVGSSRTYAINCLREQYKPSAIVLTCADAGISVDKLKWSRWSRTTAVASGRFVWNDCKPSCVAGHFHSRPVKVTLSAPKRCPGQAYAAFGRASFSYPDGGPPFRFRHTTFVCP